MIGRGLSLFAETSVSSRLGGLCTVPSPGVDQSQCMLGPLEGAQGKKGNRLTVEGVAQVRRRLDEASPGVGVARLRHQRCHPPIPMGRKDCGAGDTARGLSTSEQ